MRKLILFICTVFTVATLYAAARPSLDGRAVVAETGTMPRGLFARTVGYLPGDSVSVTNPSTGTTIDVLILGAIDPSEGVAILLSPEAADGLRIKPDSNVQVKLTKRTGSLDENANGSAVLTSAADEKSDKGKSAQIAESEPEEKAEPAIIAEKTPSVEETVSETESAPETVEEKSVVAEAPVEEVKPLVEETPIVAQEPVKEEIISEKITESPVAVQTPLAEEKPVAEESLVAEKISENEDASCETPAVEPLALSENDENPETVYEILPPLPDSKKQRVVVIEGEEPVYQEESEKLEETPVVAEVEETVEEKKVQPVVAKEEPVVEEKAELDELAAVEEEPMVEKEPEVAMEELPDEEELAAVEEIPATAEETVPVEESPVVAEVVEETPAEVEDEYQPIVLVPAEPNPPAHEESVEVVEEVPQIAETPVQVEEEAPKVVISNDWTNYVVPSVKNLRSGSYYIQVASLGNKDNIKNFVDKYSTKYPVVLVQTSSKNAYQVMVGPLNIDEYGAVDEKFKDYGFKDAFVRKIK